MATSQVKKLNLETAKKVLVRGRGGRIQRSEIFDNNPRIAYEDGDVVELINGPGLRPYIAGKTLTHWQWKRWDISPGEIWLSKAEKEFAEPYRGAILIEPHTKVVGGNKSWRWERWQKVADSGHWFVQVGPYGARSLHGAKFVITSFRQAMAVLSVCRAFVGSEGALHHAAAALNVPAVVLWSEFISPEFTGYKTQRNIRHANGWCGSREMCMGCRRSTDAISVDEVLTNLEEVLGPNSVCA